MFLDNTCSIHEIPKLIMKCTAKYVVKPFREQQHNILNICNDFNINIIASLAYGYIKKKNTKQVYTFGEHVLRCKLSLTVFV